MEWSRVKSILICVFVLVNLILTKVYIDGNNSQIVVDKATITNTIKVLNTKNIYIDEDIIEKKTSDVPVFNISNTYKTTKELADSLYNSETDYFNPEKTTFEGETVTYKATAEDYKKVHKKLKETGIFNTCKYKRTVKKDGGITTLTYNVYNNGLLVYDTVLQAVIDKDNLTITLENWLGDNYKGTGYTNVQTAPETLISFSNGVSFEGKLTVTAMERGYIAGDRKGELQTINAIPVWKITADNGNSYYIDMRNGDFL